MSKKEQITILGAGNMGTAMAQVIATNGFKVKLWNYAGDPEPLGHIRDCRENKKYLPGIQLSTNIECEPDMAQAVSEASIVFFVVPSAFIQTVAKQAEPHIQKKAICVDMSKGLDFSSKKYSLTTDILKKTLPNNKIAILSGPAVANQMAMGEFTAMSVVSKDVQVIARLQKVLDNNHVRLMPSSDYVGVEISGAFKNVYAILIGICDGLGIAANTKALLFTMALQEISLLVKNMGGNPKTVYGLAGLGDFFTTAISASGRNRRFGELIGKGFNITEAKNQVGQIVEGILATQALYMISRKYKVRLLLGNVIYNILYKESDPQKELALYLSNVR